MNLRSSSTNDTIVPEAKRSGNTREWGGQGADRKIEADLLFSDNTINNVSTLRHGLAPKAPNDATKYLDGSGAWSTPSGLPTGAILAYGASTAPSGWLLCDGAAVSRTTYAALFAIIGSTYGAGDGSTTFNVPDLRGRPTVGVGTHVDVSALANNDGVAVGSRTPKHTHTGPSHAHSLGGASSGRNIPDNPQEADSMAFTGHNHSVGSGGTGATGSANGGYLVVQFIIKT